MNALNILEKFCTEYFIQDENNKNIHSKYKVPIPLINEYFSCYFDLTAPYDVAKPTKKEVKKMLCEHFSSNIAKVTVTTCDGLEYILTQVFDDIIYLNGAEEKLLKMMIDNCDISYYPLLKFRLTCMSKRNNEHEINDEDRVYLDDVVKDYEAYRQKYFPESKKLSEEFILQYFLERESGDHRKMINGRLCFKNLAWMPERIKKSNSIVEKIEIEKNQLKLDLESHMLVI